jgi:hypothetical protein
MRDYRAARKYCNDNNNKLTYKQMKPCAIAGDHKEMNYKNRNGLTIGTCKICGYKRIIDGNI